jgi:hypothetical protein
VESVPIAYGLARSEAHLFAVFLRSSLSIAIDSECAFASEPFDDDAKGAAVDRDLPDWKPHAGEAILDHHLQH